MNLTVNRVYLGSFEVENKVYPTAIYAVKKDLSKLKKNVVSDSEILTNQNKINSVFCDETYTKYLILAFYEENALSNDPSLIIQIEKFVGDDTKDKWLKYLGILGTAVEEQKSSSYVCEVCGRDLTIDKIKLEEIFPNGQNITITLAQHFNKALQTAGFNTCKSQAHFFAQCYVETDGYRKLAENPNYRYESVLALHNKKEETKLFFNQDFFDENKHLEYFHFKVYKNLNNNTGNYTGQNYKTFNWKSSKVDAVRVPTGGDAAYKFTKGKGGFEKVNISKSEKITRNIQLLSIIYANKYENGAPSTQDGFKYRGQGAIHLTWKENYRRVIPYAKELFNESFDWVNHPEYLENNEKDAVYSAIAYFYMRLNKDISKLNNWDVKKVTYEVNGGYNGLSEREKQYLRLSTQVYKLLECKPLK